MRGRPGQDVVEWLNHLGLGQYAATFVENAVDEASLRELTDSDLRELGVSALGHRKTLLRAIGALANPPTEERPATPAAALRGEAERRQLTVLFCDLVGSTALTTRLDPEEMGAVLRRWHDEITRLIAHFGGYVARFLGDGVLAYFGWPRATEDDAGQAIRAGLAIAAATEAQHAPDGTTLAARIGIATGLVVVGEILGEGEAQEQIVVGETPNLAARLQAEAAPGQVVIAEATRRLTAGAFDLAPLGQRMLKGLAEPVEPYLALAERRATNRFEARAEGALHPLYGRDHELALLVERWRQARAGEGQAVLLVGEAGIGKSRIVRALLDGLEAGAHTRLRYQCSPYHADSAFWPVTQQLAHAAGFEPDDTSEQRLDKLEAVLAQAGKEVVSDAPLVAALMGLDGTARYGPLTLVPAALRTRTLKALVDRVVGLAAQRPVVMVVEDAHWIDPTSLELVDLVIDAVAEAAVLVVLTSRPDNPPALSAHHNVTRLTLSRLGREGVEAIVGRLGGAKLPRPVVAEIVARTDGVPLFVEELTRTVVEGGVTSVPATLHDTLMARLDRTPEVKEIAQTAACIGREFDCGLLATIARRPETELLPALDRLGQAELVFRRGFGTAARYVFKHALLRDVAYESLLKTRRQAIHARLVAALAVDSAATPPEILARHAELAGMLDRAIEEYHRAGDAAAARPAYVEAVANYDAALRLLATLPQGRERDERALAVEIARAQTLMASSGYGAAESKEGFDRARPLAEKVGDPRSLFHVDYGQWVASLVQSHMSDALARGRQALAACEPDDPAHVRTLAHRMVGTPLVMLGRFAEAVPHLQASVALYDVERHADHPLRYGMDTRAASLIYLAIARWCLGAVDAALADMEGSLAIARKADGALARCQGLGFAAMLKSWIDPANAGGLIEELFASSARDGVQFWEALAHGMRAGVRAAHDDYQGALEDAAIGRHWFDRSGARLIQQQWLGFAAQSEIALGHFDAAAAILHDIDSMIEEGERWWTKSDNRRIAGDLMLARGDTAGAEACWRAAIADARTQAAASWELRASIRLARLVAARGARAEARTLLAAACARIDGGRGTPDLVAAAALLRELETG
jgi:class 3 adenylate cyclase/tetratricopeptide (TPR) repeat protein